MKKKIHLLFGTVIFQKKKLLINLILIIIKRMADWRKYELIFYYELILGIKNRILLIQPIILTHSSYEMIILL